MNNRINIDAFLAMDTGEAAAAVTASELSMLADDAATLAATAADLKDAIIAVTTARYAGMLADLTVGTARIEDDDTVIVVNVPKRVAWDQGGLHRARARIADEWEENPAEFVDVKLTVAEAKYKAWPTPIRRLFEGARTVKPGKTTVKFERKGAA